MADYNLNLRRDVLSTELAIEQIGYNPLLHDQLEFVTGG